MGVTRKWTPFRMSYSYDILLVVDKSATNRGCLVLPLERRLVAQRPTAIPFEVIPNTAGHSIGCVPLLCDSQFVMKQSKGKQHSCCTHVDPPGPDNSQSMRKRTLAIWKLLGCARWDVGPVEKGEGGKVL